ncbi:MAG: tRNA glutamyl-Q(34) synthetase GluQRS [Tuberibacillus sp.]
MRGRFAPTPSGQLHIGNIGCALLAWLQVRSQGGTFILRIEDIDRDRSRQEYMVHVMEDLKWLGLDWDEGPDVGGSYGPYIQSARMEVYQDALKRLEEKGLLYPCYCSRKELRMIASAPHGRDSEGPVYPGTCLHLSQEERKEKEKRKKPAWRFKIPKNKTLSFIDEVLGGQMFSAGFGGDFIVKRADDMFSYQLAVVVDDALMKVSHVLRGMDLLDSTPRQLWLYEALGYSAPAFAHIPLINGPNGHRLSKRQSPKINISALREQGVRSEEIIGYLAFLYHLIDRYEPVKAEELIKSFDLTKIPHQPLVINDKLLA